MQGSEYHYPSGSVASASIPLLPVAIRSKTATVAVEGPVIGILLREVSVRSVLWLGFRC
jgi:hypothetical protein